MEKSGIDYLPLPTTFFEDSKIALIEAEFGSDGVLVVLKLFCAIFRNGFYYEWDKDVCMLFARKTMLGIQNEKVEKIVERALDRGIFDRVLYDSYGILTVAEIQQHYFSVVIRRKRIEIWHPEYLLVDVSGFKNIHLKGMGKAVLEHEPVKAGQASAPKSADVYISSENADISQQRREEYSKSKEEKEDSLPPPHESVCEEDKISNIKQQWSVWKEELLKDDGWRISVINQAGQGNEFNNEIPAKLDRFCDFLISSGQEKTAGRRGDFVRRFHYWLMDDVKRNNVSATSQSRTSKFDEASQVAAESLQMAKDMLEGKW